MTPQELKNSILQLAIQGKLVEQRPEEGTAAELVEKILAAKNAKGAKGNLTRSRGARGENKTSALSASPREKISDDEKPFDIPESWEWVRLGDVIFNHGQKTPSEDFSYIDIGSIDNKNQRLSEKETIVHASDASPRARKIVNKGDVLYATVRPYLHNVCIIDRDFSHEPIASTGFAVMACAACLDNRFLFHFLLSPDFDRYANSAENAKGVAYPAISDKRLYNAIIPLPPLAEQKRIVAKIEKLLPLIDRYEKAWSKLEDFNKRFPMDMQKSLLQMAIQGKLVEQRAEEGTAAELVEKILAAKNAKGAKKNSRAETPRRRGKSEAASPREDIPDDEKPFDIPESWAWVRFLSVVDIATNLVSPAGHENDRHIAPDNIEKGTGRLLESRTVAEDKVVSSNHRFFKGQLIYSKIRPLLRKVVIAPFDGLCSADMYPLNAQIDSSFLLFYMLSDAFNIQIARAMSSRVKMPKINQEELSKVLLPLPPLAEQKRIVAKLQELLPLCERLK